MKITKTHIHTVDTSGAYDSAKMNQYSLMKFGDKSAIRSIATEIYNFSNKKLMTMSNPMFLVVYKDIPSASYYISKLVHESYIQKKQSPKSNLLRAYREVDTFKGYSNVHYKKRSKHKKSDITISPTLLSSLNLEDDVVVIDDSYVAGTFTSLVVDKLQSLGFQKVHFIYYARIEPEVLEQAPFFEHQLNTSRISSLGDLASKLKSDNLVPTRKLVKLIFSADDTSISSFIMSLNDIGIIFVRDIVSKIDQKDLSPAYRYKLAYIKKRLSI
jgi:hypothetical protein